jgi:hypothetical protein
MALAPQMYANYELCMEHTPRETDMGYASTLTNGGHSRFSNWRFVGFTV